MRDGVTAFARNGTCLLDSCKESGSGLELTEHKLSHGPASLKTGSASWLSRKLSKFHYSGSGSNPLSYRSLSASLPYGQGANFRQLEISCESRHVCWFTVQYSATRDGTELRENTNDGTVINPE